MINCQKCGEPTGPVFGTCCTCIRKDDLLGEMRDYNYCVVNNNGRFWLVNEHGHLIRGLDAAEIDIVQANCETFTKGVSHG